MSRLSEISIRLLLVGMAAALPVAESHAQRAGRLSPPMGNVLELIQTEAVAQELELVDGQIAEIRKLSQEVRNNLLTGLATLPGTHDSSEQTQAERRAALRDLLTGQARRVRERVHNLLLPHQQQRLEQIRLQLRLRSGSARIFDSEEIRNSLSLSNEQVARLRVAAAARTKKLNEEIRLLRQRASQEVLDQVLSAEQLRKLHRMIGEPFEPERTAPARNESPNGELPKPED